MLATGKLAGPDWFILVGYFALGIVMNLASRSIAERRTMAPACTVLTAAALVVAFAP